MSEATGDWLTLKTAKDNNLFKILTNELDGGEAEVICPALEEKAAWVVLDDQDARCYAHRYGLNVIGTLGLLAWIKKRNDKELQRRSRGTPEGRILCNY